MIRSVAVWPRSKAKPLKLPETVLRGNRVILRFGQPDDWRAWAELRAADRDHLTPFEPAWPEDCLTEMFYLRRLNQQAKFWLLDTSRSFLIFRHDQSLIGGININNICRGAAQFGSLGYWLGRDYQGAGYMHEAASLLLQYAFDDMALERMNAATLIHNGRSIRMLRRLGFTEEGFATAYLQINGTRQDHALFGLNAGQYHEGLSITT